MAHPSYKERIAKRLKTLREGRDLSLTDLAEAIKTLGRSRLGNWEQVNQKTRVPGLEEADILAAFYKVSAAHILCLDDNAPVLGSQEVELVQAFRKLPLRERTENYQRITLLALAYGETADPIAVEQFAAEKKRKPKKGVTHAK